MRRFLSAWVYYVAGAASVLVGMWLYTRHAAGAARGDDGGA